MATSIAVIGECMLELTHAKATTEGAALPMSMSYGGDTVNTSIYLSRNDISVSYVSALGDDLMSDWLIEEWQKEGIDCSLVSRKSNSVPGMYMINVDDAGERSFLYWRKGSPASRLFDDSSQVKKLIDAICGYDYVYLSGISMAILPSASVERLFDGLERYRAQGGKVIFDGNYRPKLWSSQGVAQQAYTRIYKMTDIALPTFEDEELLFGYGSSDEVMQAIRNLGVDEIVVKMGGDGCLALDQRETNFVAAERVEPVDTTAAGDSFNAGYLASRFKQGSVLEACRAGHLLASRVIQHQGAIIPS